MGFRVWGLGIRVWGLGFGVIPKERQSVELEGQPMGSDKTFIEAYTLLLGGSWVLRSPIRV